MDTCLFASISAESLHCRAHSSCAERRHPKLNDGLDPRDAESEKLWQTETVLRQPVSACLASGFFFELGRVIHLHEMHA